MARRFITSRVDRIYRDAVSGLTTDISKRSTFFTVLATTVACPNCNWDPTGNCSTGVYNGTGPQPFTGWVCPMCTGQGKITTEKKRKRAAAVAWGKADPNKPNVVFAQATLPIGFARVKLPSTYHQEILTSTYFLVDGFRCSIVGQPQKRGLQTYVETEFVVKKDV